MAAEQPAEEDVIRGAGSASMTGATDEDAAAITDDEVDRIREVLLGIQTRMRAEVGALSGRPERVDVERD